MPRYGYYEDEEDEDEPKGRLKRRPGGYRHRPPSEKTGWGAAAGAARPHPQRTSTSAAGGEPDDENDFWHRQPTSEPVGEHPQLPEFRPASLDGIPQQFAAELTELAGPAYVVEAGMIHCRLPGCARPAIGFATVAAWRVHVRRAGCHKQLAFCASCGHRIDVPDDLSAEGIQVRLDAHRTERSIFRWIIGRMTVERWIFKWVKDLVGWNISSGFDSSTQ
ncbi:unnamed protein product [Anisakis simplex]|uniref:E3 ubiquitin-protein ligase n=1 Tax=Anisakis simplex TaxID=6269 RepID=A0A0M3K714_ANISI|nr:unnamed protein product [Anisakis simplex]